MLLRLVQLVKARTSISVTLSGIETLVRLVQFSKADTPIDVTPLEITTFFTLWGFQKPLLSAISPVPVMVSVPSLSRVQVRLSPHLPDVAADKAREGYKQRQKNTAINKATILFLVLCIYSPPEKLIYHKGINPSDIISKGFRIRQLFNFDLKCYNLG